MINNRLFDGELPEAELYWLNESNIDIIPFEIDAVCIPWNNTYFIGIYKMLPFISYSLYFNSMVHEMIHIWQCEKYGVKYTLKHQHGREFKKMCQLAYEEFYL